MKAQLSQLAGVWPEEPLKDGVYEFSFERTNASARVSVKGSQSEIRHNAEVVVAEEKGDIHSLVLRKIG